MNVSLRAAVVVLAQVLVAVAGAPAQSPAGGGAAQDPTRPTAEGQGNQQNPTGRTAEPLTPGTQMPGASNPLRTRWATPRRAAGFQGFPVFPSQLQGYGNAPVPGGLPTAMLPPVPAEPEPPGWPAWVRLRDKEPLPFSPEQALLIRHADRVWHRASADEPFVPLFFHDKLRALQAGAAVEVRQVGEFELLLHKSTRLMVRGPSQVEIVELTATDVHLRIASLTWLRLGAMERNHLIELPDGSVLRIAPPPPALVPAFLPLPIPMSAPLPGVTELVLSRADEPAWLGGRATLTNLGSTDVRWQHAGGEVVLAPSERVTFFLQRPQDRVAAGLDVSGGTFEKNDAEVVCRTPAGGRASWSGATFELPPGAAVRFDPQQGRPFDPPPPPPRAAAPAAK